MASDRLPIQNRRRLKVWPLGMAAALLVGLLMGLSARRDPDVSYRSKAEIDLAAAKARADKLERESIVWMEKYAATERTLDKLMKLWKSSVERDSRELLVAAAQERRGMINTIDGGDTFGVFVGDRRFCEDKPDPRQRARWKDAIEELRREKFVERGQWRTYGGPGTAPGYEEWRLTTTGYAMADTFKALKESDRLGNP